MAALIEVGSLETCSVIEMEVLRSARSERELREIRSERRVLPLIPTTQADFDRAIDVMEQLAAIGQLRRASLPDLLVAAVAERAGSVLLHYDSDFDAIASVTGQPAEWVVRRGSVP